MRRSLVKKKESVQDILGDQNGKACLSRQDGPVIGGEASQPTKMPINL
jgi:hypothetical protein